MEEKTPLSLEVVSVQMLISGPKNLKNSEVSKSNLKNVVGNYLFLETMLLHREPFLPMF